MTDTGKELTIEAISIALRDEMTDEKMTELLASSVFLVPENSKLADIIHDVSHFFYDKDIRSVDPGFDAFRRAELGKTLTELTQGSG